MNISPSKNIFLFSLTEVITDLQIKSPLPYSGYGGVFSSCLFFNYDNIYQSFYYKLPLYADISSKSKGRISLNDVWSEFCMSSGNEMYSGPRGKKSSLTS